MRNFVVILSFLVGAWLFGVPLTQWLLPDLPDSPSDFSGIELTLGSIIPVTCGALTVAAVERFIDPNKPKKGSRHDRTE